MATQPEQHKENHWGLLHFYNYPHPENTNQMANESPNKISKTDSD